MNNDNIKPNYGFGIGHKITNLELFFEEIIKKIMRLISKYIVEKFKAILRFIIIHFKSTKNLGIYSKYMILLSLLIYLIKMLINYYISDKHSFLNKKYSNLLFLKNIKNKKFSFDEEKTIQIVKLDIYKEKIKNYIKMHKDKLQKYKIENKETIDDPYFKLMKYYLEYNQNCNNFSKILNIKKFY